MERAPRIPALSSESYEPTSDEWELVAWAEKAGLVDAHEQSRIQPERFYRKEGFTFNNRAQKASPKNFSFFADAYTRQTQDIAVRAQEEHRAHTEYEHNRLRLGRLAEVFTPRILEKAWGNRASVHVGSVVDDRFNGADAFSVERSKGGAMQSVLRYDTTIASDAYRVVDAEGNDTDETRHFLEDKLVKTYRRILRGTLGQVSLVESGDNYCTALSVPGVIVPIDEPLLFAMLKSEKAQHEGGHGRGMVDTDAVARAFVQSAIRQLRAQIRVAEQAGNPKGCVQALKNALASMEARDQSLAHIVPRKENATMRVLDGILEDPDAMKRIVERAREEEAEYAEQKRAEKETTPSRQVSGQGVALTTERAPRTFEQMTFTEKVADMQVRLNELRQHTNNLDARIAYLQTQFM